MQLLKYWTVKWKLQTLVGIKAKMTCVESSMVHSSLDCPAAWAGYLPIISDQVLCPSATSFTTDATSSMLTRICSLLSLSRIVTLSVESTVTAKGTPISSVLAYRFPIDVPVKNPVNKCSIHSAAQWKFTHHIKLHTMNHIIHREHKEKDAALVWCNRRRTHINSETYLWCQ